MRAHRLAALAVLVAACETEPTGLPRPEIPSAAVVPNIHNVLSAMVSARLVRTDSVAVQFRREGDPPGSESATPMFPVKTEIVSLPVLGLLPNERYTLRVIAYGEGRVTVGSGMSLRTGSLPADLPRYVASGSAPSPGYIVFASGRYGLVIDNTGRIVWYRHFPDGAGLNFMAQPTGRYVVRPPTPEPGDTEPWVELDALGNVTRTMSCVAGLQPRPHDLILEADGSYRLLCDETRTMNLTAYGGVANARVTGTVVQHISATGELLFQWSPFDHFAITDVDPAERSGPTVNWTHGNALDVDEDGNLLVSFRNLSEITKIDGRTGAVIWRLGGRRNQFTFDGTTMPAFSHQHGVRACGAGTLIILDNVGDPRSSRAERYVIEEGSRTARLTQAYASVPTVVTEIGGSVQSLADGRTLVSFGTAGRVEEYDASGRLTWHIEGNPGYVFRAQRIQSLYAPGAGMSR